MKGVVEKPRALILDFDGVILESNHLKTEAFAELFGRFPEHRDAMMAYHAAHVSEPRHAKFRHLVVERLGWADGEALVGELAEEFSRRILGRMDECPTVKGAVAFLEEFAARLPLYLASVTPEAELLEVLRRRNLGRYFAAVYGCPPWTKAAAVAAVIARHGGDPHGIVLIGDSAGDQGAARRAGIEFIARDSGLPFEEPRPPAYPDAEAVGAGLRRRFDP